MKFILSKFGMCFWSH